MPATLQDLKAWRPADLTGRADTIQRTKKALLTLGDELRDAAPPASWQSGDSAAARTRHQVVVDEVEEVVAVASALVKGLDDAGATFTRLQEELGEVEDLARRTECTIDLATGGVGDAKVGPVTDAKSAASYTENRQAAVDEVFDRLEQIARALAHADAGLVAVLSKVTTGLGPHASLADAAADGSGAAAYAPVSMPGEGARAADLNAWWNTLSEDQQRDLIAQHPEQIGNRDGIPAWARDQANRAQIAPARAAAQAEIDRLNALPAGSVAEGYDRARLVAEAQHRLDAINAVQATLDKGGRQLLVFDPFASVPLAAIAVGDVDTADNVSVFTPGMGSDVAGDLSGYDDQMAAIQQEAAGKGSTAVVTWIGYETPDDLGQANTSDYADTGAPALASFLTGINASRDDDPHLTAMGHSYGSFVTGKALTGATGVDDVVVFGSPGIGTGDLGDLNVPAGHVYYMEAPGDTVAGAAVPLSAGPDGSDVDVIPGANRVDVSHGRWITPDGREYVEMVHREYNPVTEQLEVTAYILDAQTGQAIPADQIPADAVRYASSGGHSEYLKPGTASAHAMAQIVAGRPPGEIKGLSTNP